jgi:hypothetical protein
MENNESGVASETPLVDAITDHRKVIKAIAESVRLLKFHSAVSAIAAESYPGAKGEVIANVTLAYRHLEDAAMRLGKALQANDGGVSVYDK